MFGFFRTLFKGEKSFEHFLELLSKMPERLAIKIHGDVLMGNHYHFQLGGHEGRSGSREEMKRKMIGQRVKGDVVARC
jgi:hypothetical protein